jgi:cytochrome c5
METLKAVIAVAAAAVALGASAQPRERTGEEIVKAKCVECHAQGVGGAPRIDDRAAWAARMKNGLDATVKSAIRGHGKMPARGGQADLTDAELRAAILYLFNPAGVPPRPAPAAALAPNQRIVEGTEIYLGVKPRTGSDYHVNVTLRDAKTHAPIGDADVEAKITDPVRGAVTKKLAKGSEGGVVSYGNDFTVTGREPHAIVVMVRRKGARPIEAQFDFRQ